ncbi:hypothetical protein QTP88_012737 [Uroleucon formosanum]
MSGNKSGVRRLISEKAGREVPYIHCRAHVLSFALTSMRNKFPKIKRVFHVLKDIYKLFHQSPKREEMLHRVQTIINDPILKIPEAIEIRWLSHYKIVHAIKQSYIAIATTCEHIHQDGADLASLAGGILLSLREESFIILLCGLDEILSAVSNLSLTLQSPNLCISVLPTIIKSTKDHLNKIAESLKQDVYNSTIIKNATEISKRLNSLKKDYGIKNTLKYILSFLEQVIKEMDRRFNDTAVKLIEGCSIFENYSTLSDASEKLIEQLLKRIVTPESIVVFPYHASMACSWACMSIRLWRDRRTAAWNLEQTVALLLFRGSNYIEYVDCDIEGDTGQISRAENVTYLGASSTPTEVRDVIMVYSQAEVLLQLKFEYNLLSRDEDEIEEFHIKIEMITSAWEMPTNVSHDVISKLFNA